SGKAGRAIQRPRSIHLFPSGFSRRSRCPVVCHPHFLMTMVVKFMKQLTRTLLWAWLALWPVHWAFGQSIVINEIMYHPLQPALGPEPLGEEYIELYNIAPTNVNLAGWHFNKGVGFVLPNLTLAPGGYLVVSADTNAFHARYPTVNNVVGNWTG